MFALFIQEQEQQLGKARQAKAKDKKEEVLYIDKLFD